MRTPRRPKAKPLATLPMKARSSKSRKLSLEQQVVACKLLATGMRPTALAKHMRKKHGVEATAESYASYLTTRALEITQYKKAWNEGVKDKVHLRYDGARLLELICAYGLLVSRLFREMCPTCAGVGTTTVMRKQERTATRCKTCKGHKWIIPKAAEAYALGDDLGATALRLAGNGPPPGCDLAVWDRLLVCLRQIREEVGDAKPEKGVSTADDVEALARAALLRSLKEDYDKMSPEEKLEVMRSAGAAARKVLPLND